MVDMDELFSTWIRMHMGVVGSCSPLAWLIGYIWKSSSFARYNHAWPSSILIKNHVKSPYNKWGKMLTHPRALQRELISSMKIVLGQCYTCLCYCFWWRPRGWPCALALHGHGLVACSDSRAPALEPRQSASTPPFVVPAQPQQSAQLSWAGGSQIGWEHYRVVASTHLGRRHWTGRCRRWDERMARSPGCCNVPRRHWRCWWKAVGRGEAKSQLNHSYCWHTWGCSGHTWRSASRSRTMWNSSVRFCLQCFHCVRRYGSSMSFVCLPIQHNRCSTEAVFS